MTEIHQDDRKVAIITQVADGEYMATFPDREALKDELASGLVARCVCLGYEPKLNLKWEGEDNE